MAKKTKLKKLDMTSVDLVRRGANQKADIRLYKSAEEDMPAGLLKSVTDAVREWWNGEQEGVMKEFKITKSSFMDALDYSMESIINDDTMDSVAKAEMAEESINQFADALLDAVMKTIGVYKATEGAESEESGEEDEFLDKDNEKPAEDNSEGENSTENIEEGEREMKIDKSRFTPEELEQYNALIAKGEVMDPDDEFPPRKKDDMDDDMDDDMEEDMDKGCKTKKSADLHPEVKKALEEIEAMKKSYEMKELHEVAKKYSVLGKKEEELANTLYSMKKSSPENYDSYIALLDEQVSMVEKSGVFTEIGKSGHGGYAGGDTVSKINSIASDIQKADPSLNRYEAIAKAWDSNPELLEEYEREYTK